jgi:hypothetical protein
VKLLFLFLTTVSFVHAKKSVLTAEVVPGCQGEGCDCIEGAELGKTMIQTTKPMKLYMEPTTSSKLLANFPEKIKAMPMRFDMVIVEKGEHKVVGVKNKNIGLKAGDVVDSLIYIGEGNYQAKHDGHWIKFKKRDVELKSLKETKIEEWLQVMDRNNGTVGFTADKPFAGCAH